MNKFKVLLVYPNLQMVNLLPTNIAVLAACLKQSGADVRLFDTTLYRTAEKSVDEIRVEHMQLRPFNLKDKGVEYKTTEVFKDFRDLVNAYKPDLIGISATDDTYDLGIALISRIKNKDFHLTVGGIHATFSPEKIINNSYVDSVCVGEGESSLVELCRNLSSGKEITAIDNLWVKDGDRIFRNKLREPVDLEKLPYEDFSIFEEKRLFRPMQGKVRRMIPIATDRGCPFACAFCAAPSQKELYLNQTKKPYFRLKSVKRVIAELRHQLRISKPDYIYFNSETFFARNDSELKAFAREYSSLVGLPFWCQTRIETITDDKIKMLKEMNCDRVSIGLEHGNEAFRKKILKKNFTNRQVIDAFRILEKNKITVTVNNIIGFPDETRELVFDTIELNRKLATDSINAYFFVPYTGTPLRQYCLDRGYISPDSKTDSLMRSSILDMPQFKSDEIKGLVRTFPLYVKLPRSYFKDIKTAEQLNGEGDLALARLRDIYFKEYFN